MASQISLTACAGSTWMMTGLIWFVAVVHYPLFNQVGSETYPSYQQTHMRRTTWVVAPLMLVELVSSCYLVARPPSGVASGWLWIGLVTVVVNWLSTGLIQVPLHSRLVEGFDAETHRQLVVTNWVRVLSWSIHSGCLAMIFVFRRNGLS